MSKVQVPQWMFSSFITSLKNIGATGEIENINILANKLLDVLKDKQRYYHNLKNLAFILTKIDELADSTHNSDCVRIAAWYNAVYFNSYLGFTQPAFADINPIEILFDDLLSLGVDFDVAKHVSNIISIGDNIKCTSDVDAQVLFDCSIAIFASTPQEFKNFLDMAQKECSSISSWIVLKARKRFVNRLLTRAKIFLSPMGQMWEIPARQNLSAELVRLEAKLKGMPTSILDGAVDNLQNDNTNTSDTVVIKRVSIANKLLKAKNNSVQEQDDYSSSSLNKIPSINSNTQSITKIDDLTSSLEMVEDCLESTDKKDDNCAENIEFE